MRILLVDESSERSDRVFAALREAGYDIVAQIHKDEDLRRSIGMHDPDLVIIDLQSPYRDYLEDLKTINRETPRPIAMFVADGDPALLAQAIDSGVSVYAADGFSPKLVKSILQLVVAQFDRFKRLNDELERSKSALTERKLIERAKGLLMAHQNLSEDQAYRLLRKMAMDQNRRLADIADSILSLSHLLKK